MGVDVIRMVANKQQAVLVSVDDLGSVMAWQLVSSGFCSIGLIDPDALELSNLNHFVSCFRDNLDNAKVQAVKEHLLRNNPDAHIAARDQKVQSAEAETMLAGADWIILSTEKKHEQENFQ